MKKNKLIKLRKSRIREIIKEEILKLKEQSPSTPTNSTLNYQNGQYQFHFCEAVTPPNPTTNIQANNYACPNAMYVQASNCSDANDTQNYYLVTEMDGQTPSVGDKYCGAATSNLDSVNGDENLCNGPILKITAVLGSPPAGYLIEPRKNISSFTCQGGTSTSTTCSQMTTPISQNFQSNVQTHGWNDTFTCLVAASNNPCSLLREKLRRWNDKLPTVGPNQQQTIMQRVTFALDLGNNTHSCNNLQNLSPSNPDELTGGNMDWNANDWENQFDNKVSNVNNPCNFLSNRLTTFNNKLAQTQAATGPGGGTGWSVQQIDMLNHKIAYTQQLQIENNC